MSWTERQVAMLAEMGLHVPVAATRPRTDAGTAVAERPVAAPGAAAAPSVPGAPTLPAAPATATATAAATAAAATMPPTPEHTAAPRMRSIAATPPPTHADGMDWPTLREAAAACTACGLCQGRTRSVFGVGAPQAHWLVVGEAPGEAEDAIGEPFAGKPGQLLDNMLAALGLSRDDGSAGTGSGGETPSPATRAYLVDAVKCRPPGNRNATAEELATCEPWLARQVALLQPKVILAMGRAPVQQLLRTDEPIGKLRGRVHHYRGVPVIVTFHPNYLSRVQADKARAWDDLCLARETYAALTSSS